MKKRKAQPPLFKTKPLTAAQKRKILEQRKEITKKNRALDPFYIHPDDVPSDKGYQWFSLKTPSVPYAEKEINLAIDNGWKYVPYTRHKFGRSVRGRLVVDDCVLMENSREYIYSARNKEINAAKAMLNEGPIASSIGTKSSFPLVSDTFITSSDFKSVPFDAPPIVVPVTIQFRMDRDWQNAAAFLNLTNDEYARRRLSREPPVLVSDYNAIYEAVELMVRHDR